MSNETIETFVFFGIMGSGKGTQIKLLTDFLKVRNGKEVVYAGPGEGFRELINSGNYTGNIIKEFHDNGILVPDFITNSLFTNILISSLTDQKHLVVDGYPRAVAQSKNFEDLMKFYKRYNIKIIYINVKQEEAVKRNLSRGRKDDTEEGISRRIKMFFDDVVPSMEYFKGKSDYEMIDINGEQTIEEVHKEIISKLGFASN